jgi:hypothetical protein
MVPALDRSCSKGSTLENALLSPDHHPSPSIPTTTAALIVAAAGRSDTAAAIVGCRGGNAPADMDRCSSRPSHRSRAAAPSTACRRHMHSRPPPSARCRTPAQQLSHDCPRVSRVLAVANLVSLALDDAPRLPYCRSVARDDWSAETIVQPDADDVKVGSLKRTVNDDGVRQPMSR